MNRILLLFAVFFCSVLLAESQKVDSVMVEQTGDLIKVHYKILNSSHYQLFRVTVFCSINGGLKSELKSLSGDFGESVAGGRNDYMVLWDVLKDVDEVNTVDFSVKAELIRDETPRDLRAGRKKGEKIGIHLIFTMDSEALVFGPRLGYLRNWGISAGTLQGSYYSPTDIAGSMGSQIFPVGTEVGVPFSIYTFDLTKRIVNKNKFQLHGFGGLAIGGRAGDRYDTFYTDYTKRYSGINIGLIMDLGLFAFSAEGTTLSDFSEAKFPDFFAFGAGFRF